MSKKRLGIPQKAVEDILLKSRRRCALCFHLSGDDQPKVGSIAHIGSASEEEADALDNLVFLCQTHHEQLDMRKEREPISPEMVKAAREELYRALRSPEMGGGLYDCPEVSRAA